MKLKAEAPYFWLRRRWLQPRKLKLTIFFRQACAAQTAHSRPNEQHMRAIVLILALPLVATITMGLTSGRKSLLDDVTVLAQF